MGYQNSKYRDFFSMKCPLGSDLPMMFFTHIIKFLKVPIKKGKSQFTLIIVLIFTKIVIELYEKVGKNLLTYRKISQKIFNIFAKFLFHVKT